MERCAGPLQRQDRERPRGQEMLHRAAVMVALMRAPSSTIAACGVVPADGARCRRARGCASARRPPPPAARADRARRRCRCARRRARLRARNRAIGCRAQRDAFRSSRARSSAADQRRVLHHVGERLAGLDLAREGEEDRPHRVAEAAVGDRHVEDRLRVRPATCVPHAERFQHAPRRRRRSRKRAGRRRTFRAVTPLAPSAGSSAPATLESVVVRAPAAAQSPSARPGKPAPAIE